jgi:hypothetical protein
MAPFYQSPNPTNDPNYLGMSKEPDRVTYAGDTAMGKLFEDIGQTGSKAIGAVTDIFKTAIKSDAHSLIDPIQAEHGSYMDPEGVKEVAGTGAKGRVRVQQMQKGAGAFDGDGGGVDEGGGPAETIFPEDAKPLPRQATNEISQLHRLTQAYNAGNLSDSYYDAQLVSVAKQLRAKYPGFRDEVDQAISQITGIQPANALRSSLVRDIQANQAAVIASQNSDQKFREKYRAEASSMGLDPDNTPIEVLKPAVSQYVGDRETLKAKQLRAEVGSPEAEATMSDTVAQQVQSSISAFTNKAQGNTPYQEFVKKAQELTIRGGGNPKEIAELATQMERAKIELETMIRTNLYKPIEGRKDGHSLVTLVKEGDQKVTTILNNQLKPWNDMIALVKSGNFSALETVTNMNKHQSQIDVQNLNRAFPQARVASAISQAFPNNPIMVNRFLETSDILPDWQKAVKNGVGNAILGGTSQTPAPTPTEALKAYGPNAAKGPAAKETLKQYDLVISKENKNTPNAAHVATQFFKDQSFYDSLNDSARMKTFMTMVSPEKTKFIQSIASQNPEVLDAHQKWVKYAAGDIFRRNSDDLNSLLSRKDVDIAFNPTTMQFEDRTPRTTQTYATVQRQTQQNLQSINNAITLVRPVVGDDAGAVLSALGIDPNPKKEDGIVTRMFNALGEKLSGWRTDLQNEAVGEGAKKAPTPGKQSMNDLPAAALRHVTAEAESGGDYNAVFGMGKSDKRDLSGNTVGEIMAMQKHYTDSGSPSSAIGKYQFLRKTLDSLVKEGVIARDEPFTPDVQERAFTALAKRRGLDKYLSGEMDEGGFMNSLAKEWAGLPQTNGMSFYQGDGLNKATTGPKKVMEAIRKIKQEG